MPDMPMSMQTSPIHCLLVISSKTRKFPPIQHMRNHPFFTSRATRF